MLTVLRIVRVTLFYNIKLLRIVIARYITITLNVEHLCQFVRIIVKKLSRNLEQNTKLRIKCQLSTVFKQIIKYQIDNKQF